MLCLAYLHTYHPFSNKATLQYLIPGSTVNFLFDHSVCRCSSDVRASAWSCSFRSTATASSCLLSLYLALLSCQPVVQFLCLECPSQVSQVNLVHSAIICQPATPQLRRLSCSHLQWEISVYHLAFEIRKKNITESIICLIC